MHGDARRRNAAAACVRVMLRQGSPSPYARLLCGVALLLTAPATVAAQTPASSNPTVPFSGSVIVDTADPAIPTAQEIIVDLPSALHMSRHQRGEINGLRYVLFSDGSGAVMQAQNPRTVLFRLNCVKGISCTISDMAGKIEVFPAVRGPKPTLPASPDGAALAGYIAEWVLAGTGPDVVQSPPQEKPAENVAADVATAELEPVTVKSEGVMPACSGQGTSGGCSGEANQQSNPIHKVSAVRTRATTQRKPTKTAPQQWTVKEEPVVRDAPVAQTTKARETIFERMKLSCSISGSVTLRYTNHDTSSTRFGKPRASLGCGARLSKKLYLRVSVLGYGDKHQKAPWDAEFTYALTYRATEKLTLSYSNYSGRIENSSSTFVDSLTSGTLRASYKLPKVRLPNEKTIGCSASLALPDLTDKTINLTCSYAVTERLWISGTAYAYFPGKQETWDPDFAYVASYRINDDWKITYSNYANNRFFWNKTSGSTQGILGGTISVTYKFKF